uniref:Uncharacterized protein n=1 Tax=Cucumis melo TaxID=3656 RepID=A0A9I9ED11_CUCME
MGCSNGVSLTPKKLTLIVISVDVVVLLHSITVVDRDLHGENMFLLSIWSSRRQAEATRIREKYPYRIPVKNVKLSLQCLTQSSLIFLS